MVPMRVLAQAAVPVIVSIFIMLQQDYPSFAQAPGPPGIQGCSDPRCSVASNSITDNNEFLDPTTLYRREIVIIQDALIWTDQYNGLKDGDWGKMTVDAIRAWRRANGLSSAVSLSQRDLKSLLTQASASKAAIGWAIERDERSHTLLGYPKALLQPVAAPDGTQYGGRQGLTISVHRDQSTDTELTTSLDVAATRPQVTRVNYRLNRLDRKVLVYETTDDHVVYIRLDKVGPDCRGITINVAKSWPSFGRLIAAASADFNAEGDDPQATNVPNVPHPLIPAPPLSPQPTNTVQSPPGMQSATNANRSSPPSILDCDRLMQESPQDLQQRTGPNLIERQRAHRDCVHRFEALSDEQKYPEAYARARAYAAQRAAEEKERLRIEALERDRVQNEQAKRDAQRSADKVRRQDWEKEAFQKHHNEVANLGFPEGYPDLPLMLFSGVSYIKFMSLSEWLSVLIESTPNINIRPIKAFNDSQYGLAIKEPGKPTWSISFKKDGDELYLGGYGDEDHLSLLSGADQYILTTLLASRYAAALESVTSTNHN